MTLVEAVAAACGLLCVWLTIRQNILCWPVGLVQVTLYIGIFYKVRLYSDLILHVVYAVTQFYGWYHWRHGGLQNSVLKVTQLTWWPLLGWITLGLAATGGWGYLMSTYTDAAAPYPDALIAVVSLIAQWLMVRKKLETWYFWVIVDFVAIGVYFSRELYITSGLYFVFLVLAITGYAQWNASLRELPGLPGEESGT